MSYFDDQMEVWLENDCQGAPDQWDVSGEYHEDWGAGVPLNGQPAAEKGPAQTPRTRSRSQKRRAQRRRAEARKAASKGGN